MLSVGSSGKIEIDKNKKLGMGSNGTTVYEGRFETVKIVAVKRMLKGDIHIDGDIVLKEENEVKFLKKFEHSNVIKYFLSEEDDDFTYIALEKCDLTLVGCVEYNKNGLDNPLSGLINVEDINAFKKRLLQHIILGLDYLHDNNIVHGDLKPQNILIKKVRMDDGCPYGLKAVISDFGLSREIDEGRTSVTTSQSVVGTRGWRAPEVLAMFSRKNKATKKKLRKPIDIFAYGCIIQYVYAHNRKEELIHPFGNNFHRDLNISKSNRRSYLTNRRAKQNELSVDNVLGDILINLTINKDADLRPNTKELLKNPFFWDIDTRFRFLMHVFRSTKADSKQHEGWKFTQEIWEKYHPQIYLYEIQEVWAYLKRNCKGKTPNAKSIFTLIRTMRNLQEHPPNANTIEDDDIKLVEMLGTCDDKKMGEYFFTRVPKLFPVVYASFLKSFNDNDTFASYYFGKETLDSELLEKRMDSIWKSLDYLMIPPEPRLRAHSRQSVSPAKASKS